MKPHLQYIAKEWFCSSTNYGLLGHRLLAFGYGATPEEAYTAWRNHWSFRSGPGRYAEIEKPRT